jgi:hypothetical protein
LLIESLYFAEDFVFEKEKLTTLSEPSSLQRNPLERLDCSLPGAEDGIVSTDTGPTIQTKGPRSRLEFYVFVRACQSGDFSLKSSADHRRTDTLVNETD